MKNLPTKEEIIEAARISLKDKWIPLSKARSIERVDNILPKGCAMCRLMMAYKRYEICVFCILGNSYFRICNNGYSSWNRNISNKDIKSARRFALQIVEILQKIVRGEFEVPTREV